MGQKTHPTGFRVGIIQKWASSWFAKVKDYREFVAEDAKIRKYVKKKLYAAGISKIPAVISRRRALRRIPFPETTARTAGSAYRMIRL